MITTKEKFKLAGLEMKYFIPISLILIVAVVLGKLPAGMLGAFPIMIVIGAFSIILEIRPL